MSDCKCRFEKLASAATYITTPNLIHWPNFTRVDATSSDWIIHTCQYNWKETFALVLEMRMVVE